MMTAKEILAHFSDRDLAAEHAGYLAFHCRRYEFLLKTIEPVIAALRQPDPGRTIRILDVGPYFQTDLIRGQFDAVVDTIGFGSPMPFEQRSGEEHFQYNLLALKSSGDRPEVEPADLVVLAEVIEHLDVSPKQIFRCCASWLTKGGYLIVQTPNAVSLKRRLSMLFGRQPFDMPAEEAGDFSVHIREYTIRELRGFATDAGFTVIRCRTANYFNRGGLPRSAYDVICHMLPSGFRSGITMVLRK
jgi:hypothetical protein